MKEASDGVRDLSNGRKDGQSASVVGSESGKPDQNLSESASRNTKMVESSVAKVSSASESKVDKAKVEKSTVDKKYDSRDRNTYRNVNGVKPIPGGRGRRDDDIRGDRRTSPTKPFRKDVKSTPSTLSYRRDGARDLEQKKTFESSKTYPEETRLAKLVKKIQRETDRERRLYTAKQLVDHLHTSEGAKQITRNSNVFEILNPLKDVLFERGYKDVKNEVTYCIGFMGMLLGADAQGYFQWLFGSMVEVEDDVRIMFLQALTETLKCDEKKQSTAEFTMLILNNLQTLLENADTPELLMSVVNVILQVTKVYPNIFQDYFRDTVDILVGWHIDSSQRDKVTEFTSKSLISFKQFWVSDQEFTKELLGQFLEDMEAYAEDLIALVQRNQVSMTSIPDEVVKICSLLKVFSTVIKSLGEDFDPNMSRDLDMTYLIDVFNKTTHAIESSIKCCFYEPAVVSANEYLCLMLHLVRSDVYNCQEGLLSYLGTLLYPPNTVANKYCSTTITLLGQAVEKLGTQLPVEWLSSMIKADSLVQTCKLSHDTRVLRAMTQLYKSLLSLKSIPLLEETYRHILGDIQQGFNTLLDNSGDENLLELVTRNPFEKTAYKKREAEAVCIFNLCVLGEIGNNKNNLIGMWALSPSLFDLYCEHLDIVRPSISIQYPALQYSIIQSLYTHSTTHGNFISTSSLLTQSASPEGSHMANVNPTTSNNFTRLLKVLSLLLTHSNTSYDSKLLGVKWVTELVSSLHSSAHVYTTRQFLTLVQALYHTGYDQEEDVAMAVQNCLTNLFQNPKSYPRYIIKGCVKLCMYRLNEGIATLRDNFISLLCLLPINVTASKNNGLYLLEEDTQLVYSEASVGLDAMWQVCRNFSQKALCGSFHSNTFRNVMGYLLQDNVTKQAGSQPWLDAMFQSAQRASTKPDWKSADPLIMQNFISHSSTVQWFWATWQASQYCIMTKLRTPLGKPQETFTSIENAVKKLACQVNEVLEEEDTTKPGKSSSSVCEVGLKVKLLLQFMEHLEKHLYNAYEGAAVSMSAIPKVSRSFFRTNKSTCLEWLGRTRMFMLVMSQHAGMHTHVLSHATHILNDLEKDSDTQGYEVEIVLQYLVPALCELGEADSIHGISIWCKDVFGKKISWIKAAIEKACGRYENAAKEFRLVVKTLLQSDEEREEQLKESSGSSKITSILAGKHSAGEFKNGHNATLASKLNLFVNEVIDCYARLNDWESILEWQDTYTKMRSDSSLTLSAPTYTMDMCLVRAMSAFDNAEVGAVQDHLDLIPGLSGLTKWGLSSKEQDATRQLLQASVIAHKHTINNHKSEIIKHVTETLDTCESVLKVQGMDWPILASPNSMALLSIAATLQDHVENKTLCLLPLSERLQMTETDDSISSFLHAIRLTKLQQAIGGSVPELSEQLFKLQLASASLARKQQNTGLAQKLLIQQADYLLDGQSNVGRSYDLDSLKTAVKKLQGHGSVKKLDTLRIERESAKLIHCMGDHRESLEMLANSVVCHTGSDRVTSGLCSELCSRSLLTLVAWLQVDYKLLSSLAGKVGQGDGLNSLSQNIQILLDLEEKSSSNSSKLVVDGDTAELKIGDNPILTDTERIVGRLLQLSTMQCETLPKSWYTLASWCYKWGRKAVDNARHGSVQLYAEEKAQIYALLPESIRGEERDSVVTILGRVHSSMSSEEDISDQDQSQYDDGAESTRRQLFNSCSSLFATDESCVDNLLDVWRGVVTRIYHYYHLSACAFFKFLKLNGVVDQIKDDNTEDCNVVSTLRVLRLLVKHAGELRNVLETGLAATPTAPWKGIIPQLFSRLSHPESYVRQSISDLLCRVAEDAPHLIVYPAVVGSSTSRMDTITKPDNGILNNYLADSPEPESALVNSDEINSQDTDDLPSEIEAESMLHNCIGSMLNTLAANFPQMISDVKQLIEELRRITLLWDELWLGTLNQQHQEVERRIANLEAEIKKVNNNTALSKEEKAAIIREKHKAGLKPTVYAMERLHEITSQCTETPHEKWFQDVYGQQISTALEKLRNPSNPGHPRASWHPFKQIHLSLQQKAQKRNSLNLSMEEISPKLHSLRNTVIAMPGLGTAGQIVTIESVSNAVQILPTKTKPKKLVFKGSDGKKYPYLFKGLEDLHLDERIMQFLNIVNNMFASAKKGSHELYRARHYSVTPLGPRSGLIQWVDGVTPLFSLYKKWQQREALIQLMKQHAAGNTSAQQPPVPRPSEVYYNKLTPLLREKGIKDMDSRKDWPLSVQRKVLEELMVETPKDLLARELWLTSMSPNEWWYITQTYARSTAVMSMIGYIIGLGDRHLDNILVDLSTGEVVHIDYNVCFEKGKSLRVPEKAPFRLTQNIEAAFGITGVEGTFRIASEHVMKTLRRGRETLLTLLEAFVYDPLVDWTTGNEGGYTGAFYGGGHAVGTNAQENRQGKLDMEKEVNCSMFSIRVAEMKVAWMQNREDIVTELPQILAHLDSRSDKIAEYTELMAREERSQELKQFILEAQSNSNSPVFTLHDRYKEYVVIKTSQDSVSKLVEEKITECMHWQAMHKHVMQKIQGSAFQKMCSDIASSLNLGTPSFAAAKEFLQGAGQGSIIQQCEQVENELTSTLQIQRNNLHRVIDVLHTFGSIVSQFGLSFAENTRTGNYLHWLKELVADFSESKCRDIVHHFKEKYGDGMFSQAKVTLVAHTEMKLQNIIQETNGRLIKLLERRSLEKAEIRLLEQQVQESRLAIEDFVTENGDYGVSSLSAVIVTVLCALNKRNLQMEAAATGVGDRLMDLTSRDGDWFLEELFSMSGNVAQFLDMIKSCQQADEGIQFAVMYKGMMATNHVYIALQDLNVNFRTIILPEALKIIQSQETSVYSILSQLETVLSESGLPLDAIISQLEVLHRNAVMGIKNENTELLTSVQGIRRRFMQLLESGIGGTQDLSPGQMLLMGFNGLFTRLDDEFMTVLECMDAMTVPDVWKKVDVIREAKALQLSSFTKNTRSLLSSLFFIRRLQVMQEFFHMCTQFAAAIQGLEGGNCYDDEQFTRPVKRFIADYVRKQIIGFPSQVLGYILCTTIQTMGLDVKAEIELKDVGAESKAPLEDLCKKAVDLCLRNGQFQQMHFTQASTLTSGQDATWRRHDLTRRLDSNLELLRNSLLRAQQHITRLHWLHEDVFIQAGIQPNPVMLTNRASVMSEIKKCMQNVVSEEQSLSVCQSQYTQLESSITQRLKWAAGANPSLNLILQQFEDAGTVRKQLAEEESKNSQEVINLCQGILHLEALRTRTPEAVASDKAFLTLVTKCTESCIMTSSANSSVTEMEALLMDMKPLEEGQKTDSAWLKSALKQINSQLKETDKKMLALKNSIDDARDGIKSKVATVKSLIGIHHKLMADVRIHMRALSKQEETDHGDVIKPGSIRDYSRIYKKFSENMTMILRMVLSEEFTADSMTETKSILQSIIQQIPQIFEDLIALAPPLISDEEEARNMSPLSFATAVKKSSGSENSQLRGSLLQRDQLTGTPPAGSPQTGTSKPVVSTPVKKKKKPSRDNKTGKAIQERNSYAIGVWRKVKFKLDGRDPDQNKRLSVPETVDYVIKDASNMDNLAVLYEGWTPWV